MRKLKLYLETSVWNFYYADDAPEKKAATLQFFKQVEQGTYNIFVSDMVFQEFANASATKMELLLHLTTKYRHEELEINEAVLQLTQQYLTQGALPIVAEADATHAAVATVYELDALISWNLKHLAQQDGQNQCSEFSLRLHQEIRTHHPFGGCKP